MMRIRSLAIAMALAFVAAPALATTSIVPKAQGSTGWSMDFGQDSVTGNIRAMNFLVDPATGSLISPLAAGGTVIIGGTLPAFASTPSFTISGSLPAFASTPTVNLGAIGGAATAAKQPQFGTAGAASADVLTVQGVASMTAIKVDGSGFTQPISAVSLPLPTGAATAAGLTTINTTLGTPLQAGGSVGISGTLPAFAVAPTVNLGTIAGVALAANQTNASQKTQIVDGSGSVIASTSNNLNVQCANCSGSGVSTADAASFTAGASLFAGSGGFFQTTPTSNPLTAGQQGMVQMTANRALFMNPRNAAGAEIATAANPYRVDPTGSTIQPVSGAVTANAGTNLNTSALALETGGNLSTLAGAITASVEQTNVKQINGVIPLVGNGVTGTGSQRVTIASDNSAFLVNDQGAVTTAAPTYTNGTNNQLSLTTAGALRTDSSTTTQPVSGTITANAGTNLNTSLLALESGGNLATLASAITGAGVEQANVKQVNGVAPLMGNGVTGTGSQRVTIASNNTPFQIDLLGNAGAIMDAAGQNAASPANELLIAGQFNTSPTTITSGNVSPLQLDNAGNLNVNIKAGAAAGGTSSNFAAAFPSAGTAIGAKNGANMVNLVADGSGNLDVNCTVGCAGGTTSNATSGVPTGSTNGQTVAWLYLFNGTNWDQAQADGSKNLKVNVAAGSVTANAGTNLNTSLLALESGGNLASLVTQVGAVTASPAANTMMDRLKSINTTLGTPMQASGGSVTANAGTNLNTSALALDTSVNGILNSQASTTSGQKGPLAQGAVTTAAPTYTTAQTDPLSLTTSGALREDTTSVNGVATLTGNGVTGAGSQRVTIASDNTPFTIVANAGTNLNTSALALDTSVSAIVNTQGSATSGEKGPLAQGAVTTASPSYTTAQTSPLSLTTAGALRTDGSAVTQPISAASLPLPSGAATSALQPTAAAQGSTTSGQTGPLAQGAVTTAAPSYTTAQTSPLSLDTAGNLRVNVTTGGASGNVAQSSTTAGETGTMAQGAVTTAAPTYTTAQTNPLSLTTAGALRVDASGTAIQGGTVGSAFPAGANNVPLAVQDSSGNVARPALVGGTGSALAAQSVDTTVGTTGLGSNGAVIAIALQGQRGAAFQLQAAGSLNATVQAQCSFDGTNYTVTGDILDPTNYTVSVNATIVASQATTDYPVVCPSGASHAQMKVTAYTNGTANWVARATTISPMSMTYGTDGSFPRALSISPTGVANVGTSAANTNPTSTLTLPAATTAYTAGWMMCTSPTAATCSTAMGTQSFAIANTAGSVIIPRLRLTTNDATSTGWGGQTITIDLWNAAPTFTANGDRAVFLPATGAAGHLASYTCVMGSVWSDGVAGECTPATTGNVPVTVKLSSGTSIFWTAIAKTGSGVTGASKVFTLTAELLN